MPGAPEALLAIHNLASFLIRIVCLLPPLPHQIRISPLFWGGVPPFFFLGGGVFPFVDRFNICVGLFFMRGNFGLVLVSIIIIIIIWGISQLFCLYPPPPPTPVLSSRV